MRLAPIAVPVGDPGGVGPQVALVATLKRRDSDRFVLFGDLEQLLEIARRDLADQALALKPLKGQAIGSLRSGEVGVVDTGGVPRAVWNAHVAGAAAGNAQLGTLRAATDAVLAGHCRALATGPVSKESVNMAGVAFTGQTEWLAGYTGLADDAVTMMFLGPRLRVALVTTHIGLARVPQEIHPGRIQRACRHLGEALVALLRGTDGPAPRVVLASLNPHAGEGGLFGDEEDCILRPALQRAAADAPFLDGPAALEGPAPAETAFRRVVGDDSAGVVALYHDQATIASKVLDWGAAVNVTWGLPFVRTSVDHGVAYDAARTGHAEADGMVAALDMAARLS